MKGLQTTYLIGRVDINQETFIHLVFTEPSADWQLWVEPGGQAPSESHDFSRWREELEGRF